MRRLEEFFERRRGICEAAVSKGVALEKITEFIVNDWNRDPGVTENGKPPDGADQGEARRRRTDFQRALVSERRIGFPLIRPVSWAAIGFGWVLRLRSRGMR